MYCLLEIILDKIYHNMKNEQKRYYGSWKYITTYWKVMKRTDYDGLYLTYMMTM